MPDHLTREQLQDVIDFSEAIYLADNMANIGFFTPYMSNQHLQELNNNPKIPTLQSIKEALSNYKSGEKNLQGYTEFMQHFDMIFERTLYSYVNTLAFDLSITCTNAFTQSDYESEQYQKDKRMVYRFLDQFDYRAEFRKVVQQVMVREVFFTWFRKTKWRNKGMRFALQIMPQDYCLLTGYWEKGLLYDLDYNYFLQPGVDIDGFDPSIKRMYNVIFSSDTKNWYNYRPTNPLNERTGQFAYWAQTSPDDGAFAFKLDMSNFNATPFLAPFLKDAIKNDEIAALQYDKDMISAYGILVGEIRLFDNAKSGTVANQFAIDPATLGGFMAKAKAGLGKLKLAAMPTENTKFYQFSDSNTSMYTNQLSTSAGVGSGISRVIYSSDRMGNAEIEAGITDQYNTMKPMYYQFQNFLDFYVNKLTKKYKFKFTLEGCNYAFEREKRFERLIRLADHGVVLGPTAWASAMGYTPMDFERQLNEGMWSDFSTKWQPMINTYTRTGSKDSTDEGGRPRESATDLTDSAVRSRDNDMELG